MLALVPAAKLWIWRRPLVERRKSSRNRVRIIESSGLSLIIVSGHDTSRRPSSNVPAKPTSSREGGAVGNAPPPTNRQVAGIDVPESNVAGEAGGFGIRRPFLAQAHHIPERHARPAGLQAPVTRVHASSSAGSFSNSSSINASMRRFSSRRSASTPNPAIQGGSASPPEVPGTEARQRTVAASPCGRRLRPSLAAARRRQTERGLHAGMFARSRGSGQCLGGATDPAVTQRGPAPGPARVGTTRRPCGFRCRALERRVAHLLAVRSRPIPPISTPMRRPFIF